MNWLRWKPGRLGGHYEKMMLIRSRLFQCDLYILRFPEGSHVKEHIDPVDNGRHYRANLTLRKPKEGGEIFIDGTPIYEGSRLTIFRPDIQKHWMTKIIKGSVLILSFGFAIKND